MSFAKVKTLYDNGASWPLMYTLHPIKARLLRGYIYLVFGE